MSAEEEGRIVVGVSRDSYYWPVFRLREMEGTERETVERYRKQIESALRVAEWAPDWLRTRNWDAVPEELQDRLRTERDVDEYIANALERPHG